MAAPQKQPKRPKRTSLAGGEQKLAYWLLVPTLVILLAIAFYPLGTVFYSSLTNERFASAAETEFVGLRNYSNLLSFTLVELQPELDATGNPVVSESTGEPVFQSPLEALPREPRRYRSVFTFGLFGNQYVLGATDPAFVLAIVDTMVFTVVSIALEVLIGLAIALVLNAPFRGRGAMRAAMLVPWAILTAVSSRIWEWMFIDTRAGFFNVVFQKVGLSDGQTPFLADESFQLPAAIIIDVWKTTPFIALLLLAGLALIPNELYEAAEVDGASKWSQFKSITLPLLKPTLAVALVFRTLDALRVFDLFQIVFAQKKYSMASYAYYTLIDGKLLGYSSAASVVIFFLITMFAIFYIRGLGLASDD
ncbi:MAG TPA: sugar ABC transporter permease [Acidimicrobiia bacterium]|nr:sugar ABC transporter permease [Acidimicrobiia bacterium]